MLLIQVLLLVATTLYQAIAVLLEDKQPPPGQMIDVGGYRLHLWVKGEAKPTIIVETSLGGVEGYFLIDKLALLARVCIYDRAGYGWSDHSPHPRTSHQIVKELDILSIPVSCSPSVSTIPTTFSGNK